MNFKYVWHLWEATWLGLAMYPPKKWYLLILILSKFEGSKVFWKNILCIIKLHVYFENYMLKLWKIFCYMFFTLSLHVLPHNFFLRSYLEPSRCSTSGEWWGLSIPIKDGEKYPRKKPKLGDKHVAEKFNM